MNIHDLINKDIDCFCGKTHRCDIEQLKIGQGILENQLNELAENYQSILIVADSNTYPLCGDRVKQLLGDKVQGVVIFETSSGVLIPNEKAINKVKKDITKRTDLILGIGSGVINDLCKYCAFEHGIKSGIIATAPSMDGYASSGAAMIIDGMKITYTTKAPSIIIGEIDILKNAPMDMIRSGYADIIGKYSALCDWKLAKLINDEYICPFVYDIVMDATNKTRAIASALTKRDDEAIGYLMEVLVLIGICLSLLSTTRPGSGSEHHLSHYFEITGLIDNKPYFHHGTDVGYATIVTAKLREKICAVENPKFSSISKQAREACYKAIYKNIHREVCDLQDTAGRYDNPITDIYIKKWDEVTCILSKCPTAKEITKMLTDVGTDIDAFEKMYGREKIERGVFFAKDLKDRYSVLWLYYDLFISESEAEKIAK